MKNHKNFSKNTVVTQGTGNIVSDMDGEKVMLSIQMGKYYNLGELGGIIWDLLSESISVQDLVDILVSEYEVQQDQCLDETTSFLELLLAENLIVIS